MPHAKPAAVQRATALVALAPLLAELGVALERVLRGTGVSADDLRPDGFIPYAAVLAILDNAAALTGRPDIGLLLGRRQTLAALGPLGRVMRHAATLGAALADFAAFQISNSTGGAVYLIRIEKGALLGYGVYDAESPVCVQIHDTVLAIGCSIIADLTRGAVVPQEILSAGPAPRDMKPYLALAGCPIRFGQSQTGLVVAASALAYRLPEANISSRDEALAALAPGLAAALSSLTGRVRHALRHLLLLGRSAMPDVAAHLGLHPRTLRRGLAKEGATFAAIKGEVRFAVARELLRLGTLSIGDIALTLDYASPSAFVHAFHRWTGASPARWRADAAA